jgi:hypothetical protein
VFQSNITSVALEKTFGVDAATVQKLIASVPDLLSN